MKQVVWLNGIKKRTCPKRPIFLLVGDNSTETNANSLEAKTGPLEPYNTV
jgi:hypothetical protein